jgi:two-component system phosphate regulon sensor histidine kinase PhoR
VKSALAELVLDSMTEAVFVVDQKQRVVVANNALKRMIGSDPIGMVLRNVIESRELRDAVSRARKDRPSAIQFGVTLKDRRRMLSAALAPLPKRAGVVVVLHDVTTLHLAARVRRDFVANASHELRTPLTAIRGFAETLRDGALEDPKIAKRFVDNIFDNAIRLETIVEDMLTLSKAEAEEAPLAMEEVNLSEVARDLVDRFNELAKKKDVKISFKAAPEVLVWADHAATEQVISNLIDNALKYGSAGKKVRVGVIKTGDRGVLRVRDDGPGIPPRHLPRVFERFYRVDKGRSRSEGGTGLGLAIVKNLTQRMGGEVTVRSRVGHGAAFRVAFPLMESPEDDE